MAEIIVNSEESLQSFIGEIRELWKARKYITVKIKFGKSRSVDQNAMLYAWYQQVHRELRENSPLEVRRFCKLHFGVPILRIDDDEFRVAYDACIKKQLSYEEKLEAMDILPVSSRMTTKQFNDYTDRIQDHYKKIGVALEYPED